MYMYIHISTFVNVHLHVHVGTEKKKKNKVHAGIVFAIIPVSLINYNSYNHWLLKVFQNISSGYFIHVHVHLRAYTVLVHPT